MNDILPPRRQIPRLTRPQPNGSVSQVSPMPQAPSEPAVSPQPDMTLPTPETNSPLPEPAELSPPQQPDEPAQPEPSVPTRSRRRLPHWLWWVLGVIILIVGVVVAAVVYYQHELQPISSTAQTTTRVTIVPDSSPRQIGQLLYDKRLIRSTMIFDVYTRLHGNRNKLQAGTYNLSAAMPLSTIIDHLVSGKTDSMRITFLPGAELRPNPATPSDKRTDIESVLIKVGFKKEDVEAAFTKQYQHPLFDGRPAGADLEGYVYGETYDFRSDATLDDIFNHVFDTYYAALQANGIIDALKQENMSLYQGITLASIVQREVSSSDPSTASHDQEQVAQVFMTRLAKGMPLGSDVTAYYGALKTGQEASVAVDTPYNTRLHAGLPPGPIATPSIGALEAVAHPAAGDYLFFLSGDDDVMYYAHTDAEHQANIKAHCQVKCAVS